MSIAKLNYWRSEKYGKCVEAMSALQDAVMKILDELEKVTPSADVSTLSEIEDNCLDYEFEILDRLHNVWQAIG